MEQEQARKLKKSVRVFLRKEAEKEFKTANDGRLGSASATLKNIPTPPRKMRLVADLVRGRGVFEALNILRYEPKVGARRMEELLKAAIANWENKNHALNLEEAGLFIKEVFVNEGRMLKRLRPAPQGRGHRIRKRSNHITMVIDSANFSNEVPSATVVTVAEENSNNA
ncbi:MAG: 50S ribosomal protein L22 [Microscillaceae bacterium]|nr:50S ribosomal protein L22 [Microscillaceae bacterium]